MCGEQHLKARPTLQLGTKKRCLTSKGLKGTEARKLTDENGKANRGISRMIKIREHTNSRLIVSQQSVRSLGCACVVIGAAAGDGGGGQERSHVA